MTKAEIKPSRRKTLSDPKFKAMVDTAMHEMAGMTDVLVSTGMNEADARLKVQQLYFKNLETFSDPVSGSLAIMAELKTRIDLDRVMNPEQDLVSEKYIELLDQMRKTTKLVLDAKGKTITHNVQKSDDGDMKFGEFIDVEVD